MHAARCHQYLMQSFKVKIIELEKVQFSAEAESYIVGGRKESICPTDTARWTVAIPN
jgi:hypothetical protein